MRRRLAGLWNRTRRVHLTAAQRVLTVEASNLSAASQEALERCAVRATYIEGTTADLEVLAAAVSQALSLQIPELSDVGDVPQHLRASILRQRVRCVRSAAGRLSLLTA